MAESSDYDDQKWAGHDFKDARRVYDVHVGRSYADAVAASVHFNDLLADSITTTSRHPFIIWNDVTGSMGEWPATMFSKLPYLYFEAKTEYLGEDAEILFGAVGDATCDRYPLQAHGFAKEEALKDRLLELKIEQGGGGQLTESYELAALYTTRNILTPNAIKPIVVFIGDEMPYSIISPDMAKRFAKVDLTGRMPTEEVFAELKRRFVVYLVRKPYSQSGTNRMSDEDRRVYSAWSSLLSDDHIVDLPDPNRVVDVLFGILANESGRVEYFMEELEGRQRPEQVESVYRSLKTVMALDRGGKRSHSGKSVMLAEADGDVAKPLI